MVYSTHHTTSGQRAVTIKVPKSHRPSERWETCQTARLELKPWGRQQSCLGLRRASGEASGPMQEQQLSCREHRGRLDVHAESVTFSEWHQPRGAITRQIEFTHALAAAYLDNNVMVTPVTTPPSRRREVPRAQRQQDDHQIFMYGWRFVEVPRYALAQMT